METLFNPDILKPMATPAPKRETRQTQQQRRKAAGIPDEHINDVYQHWLNVMRPGRKRVPQLDDKRRLRIAAAIADYGIEDCKKAIDGCALSEFHMGRNKQKKRYDDIELILRDQTHIERFLSNLPTDGAVDW